MKAGDRVRIPPVKQGADNPTAGSLEAPVWLEERVLFEDERLIALDKPSAMAVHGGSGVSFGVIEALRALRPNERHLQLVHRLDRGTSGCLLIAKRRSALRTLHALLRDGGVEKRYLALVRGQWHHGEKKIDAPLRTDTRQNGERHVLVAEDGKVAISRFRAVDFFTDASVIEALIETGRTHQIRVHGAHMDHPVAGDSRYGDPFFNTRMRELGLKRLFLHASSLSLDWPDGGSLSVSAPLPEDLAQVLTRLSGAPREPRSRSGASGHRSRSGPWRRRPKSAGGR